MTASSLTASSLTAALLLAGNEGCLSVVHTKSAVKKCERICVCQQVDLLVNTYLILRIEVTTT